MGLALMTALTLSLKACESFWTDVAGTEVPLPCLNVALTYETVAASFTALMAEPSLSGLRASAILSGSDTGFDPGRRVFVCQPTSFDTLSAQSS